MPYSLIFFSKNRVVVVQESIHDLCTYNNSLHFPWIDYQIGTYITNQSKGIKSIAFILFWIMNTTTQFDNIVYYKSTYVGKVLLYNNNAVFLETQSFQKNLKICTKCISISQIFLKRNDYVSSTTSSRGLFDLPSLMKFYSSTLWFRNNI